MNPKVKVLRLLFVALSLLCFSIPTMSADLDWQTYKHRFLAQDGRIIDTGNHNISHTEGQGFSMLFAVAANDQKEFDHIWRWTKKYLQDPQTKLFYWKYNPISANPIEDKNNASDGDVLIAWALLKAAKKWNVPEYLTESDMIVRSLLKYTVVEFGGYKVMLPGRYGFTAKNEVIINPSYFIFPAWNDFLRRTHLAEIKTLINDCYRLLQDIDWGRFKLPTDWISLSATGKTYPAARWPARVSYDAIRVPMYIKWAEPNNPILVRWSDWFRAYPRNSMPAWENMVDQSTAVYPMRGGLMAVRDLTLGQLSLSDTQVLVSDDYYSSSLKLLSVLAAAGE